jgi:drug/metabolite transporter (DMT)-like permease
VEIVLALGAALAWGFADFAGGIKSRQASTVLVTMIVLGFGGLLSLVIAAFTEDLPSGRTVVLALLAGATTGIGVTMFFHALSIGVIGTVAPISCAGAAVPVVVGLAQGERPSVGQLLGVALVVAGVVVIARAVVDDSVQAATNPRLSIILAVASAGTLGAYYIVAKEGAGDGPLWFVALGQLFAAAPLAVIVLARRTPAPGRRLGLSVCVIGVANGAGWFLSVLALREGFLSLVAVLTALYPAITVLFARFVLHERLTPLQKSGAVVTFVGVALIAAA